MCKFGLHFPPPFPPPPPVNMRATHASTSVTVRAYRQETDKKPFFFSWPSCRTETASPDMAIHLWQIECYVLPPIVNNHSRLTQADCWWYAAQKAPTHSLAFLKWELYTAAMVIRECLPTSQPLVIGLQTSWLGYRISIVSAPIFSICCYNCS